MKPQMKYLGLILDSHWDFKAHFEWLAAKLGSAVLSLSRIMPNLGGPGEGARRLYMGVVRSIAMYGAPVWCGALVASSRNLDLFYREQRKMAIRVARAYRTVSREAALLMAGSVPWTYAACTEEVTYNCKEQHARGGEPAAPEILEELRDREKREEIRHWRERLSRARAGLRVVEAIGPCLDEWMARERGGLSFHVTQVLSGHGCFGEYLHERVGREASPRCHHCPETRDTAQHTLQECPAWDVERRVLMDRMGGDLSLPTVVGKMVADPECWVAMASFCGTVVSRKEAAERERERDPNAAPERRRRGGVRRRQYLRQQP